MSALSGATPTRMEYGDVGTSYCATTTYQYCSYKAYDSNLIKLFILES